MRNDWVPQRLVRNLSSLDRFFWLRFWRAILSERLVYDIHLENSTRPTASEESPSICLQITALS